MLTLYRRRGCPRCERIRDRLQETALACEVVDVESAGEVPFQLQGQELPVLRDEGQVYEGAEAVADRLRELEAFRDEWYEFQSDACYCNENGEIE